MTRQGATIVFHRKLRASHRTGLGTGRPVIDKRYPLSEAAEAIRHSETGRAREKLVLQMVPTANKADPGES